MVNQLTRIDWDSDFFQREIYLLSGLSGESLQNLNDDLNSIKQKGAWGVQCHLGAIDSDYIRYLEDFGFRLIDSKIKFVTALSREKVCNLTNAPPYGEFRLFQCSDMEEVQKLTIDCLVDNIHFKSRYKNELLYNRQESIRYFKAWNDLAADSNPELFLVWTYKKRVIGFFNFIRRGRIEGKPLYKGILTSVDPDHRGKNAQNLMQNNLLRRFKDETWCIESVTQLSNYSVIRNHIRSEKIFHNIEFIFFKKF